jgi:hypothetical protein
MDFFMAPRLLPTSALHFRTNPKPQGDGKARAGNQQRAALPNGKESDTLSRRNTKKLIRNKTKAAELDFCCSVPTLGFREWQSKP